MADEQSNPVNGNPDLEVFVERYIKAIARSAEHVTDILLPLFFDRDEMNERQFGTRFRNATQAVITSPGPSTAFRRYRKMDAPPMYSGLYGPYRINRPFFDEDPYYQTQGYRQLHDFVVRKIRDIDIEHIG